MFYDHEYSSLVFKVPEGPVPPANNTCPFINKDAVCTDRALFILLIIVHVPINESYNSALFSEL